MDPDYLGDAVYILPNEFGGIILRTGDHRIENCDNEIVLEPDVLAALNRYLERMRQEQEKDSK